MKYLVDTHVLLWARFEPSKVSQNIQALLADPATQKHVSSISIWEISLKYSLGKLQLKSDTPEEFLESSLKLGYQVTVPSVAEIVSSYRFPDMPGHKDPFDRMLIWQAIRQGFVLLSHDAKMAEYEPYGLQLIS